MVMPTCHGDGDGVDAAALQRKIVLIPISNAFAENQDIEVQYRSYWEYWSLLKYNIANMPKLKYNIAKITKVEVQYS